MNEKSQLPRREQRTRSLPPGVPNDIGLSVEPPWKPVMPQAAELAPPRCS
ncbi:MAG: hypothetical protein AAGC55_15080 [Myxococcota bacterium]